MSCPPGLILFVYLGAATALSITLTNIVFENVIYFSTTTDASHIQNFTAVSLTSGPYYMKDIIRFKCTN